MVQSVRPWIKIEQKISVIEIRMLMWMSGATRKVKTRSVFMRGGIGVKQIVDQMLENSIKRLRYILKWYETEPVIAVKNMHVDGMMGKRRPKKGELRFLKAIWLYKNEYSMRRGCERLKQL